MSVKDSGGNMLIEEETVNHRWAEYFDEFLNVQASVVAVGGDRKMPVFGRLDDGEV